MGLIRKESTVSKLADRAVRVVPTKAVKSGATAIGGLVGVTLLSTAVSAARRRQERP